MTYSRGNNLFFENDPLKHIFVIKEGDVEVSKKVKSIEKRIAEKEDCFEIQIGIPIKAKRKDMAMMKSPT